MIRNKAIKAAQRAGKVTLSAGVALGLILSSTSVSFATSTEVKPAEGAGSLSGSNVQKQSVRNVVDSALSKSPGTVSEEAVTVDVPEIQSSVDTLAAGQGSAARSSEPSGAVDIRTTEDGAKYSADVSVEALDPGNSVVKASETEQSLITVIYSGNTADFRMDYPEGHEPVIQADGSVSLRDASTGMVVPFLKAPWALDAEGSDLTTHYAVDGDMLRQVVDTTDAKFPVIADPSLQWVPAPHLVMYGFQYQMLASVAAGAIATGAWAGCTLLNVPPAVSVVAKLICNVVGAGSVAVIANAGSYAYNSVNYSSSGCWGLNLFFYNSSPLRAMPAQDCA